MSIDYTKVFLATPAYGGMCSVNYTQGVLDTLKVLSFNDYRMAFCTIGNESLITRARNDLVDRFLKTNFGYFLFIDADISFSGIDVLKLIKSGKDVICGLYPKKFVDWDRVNIAAKQGYPNLENFAASYVVNVGNYYAPDTVIDDPVIEIDHAGTGFMLIKRNVFEQLSPHVKEYRVSTFKNPDGSLPPKVKEFFALDIVGDDNYLLSEDYFFCSLWKKHGGKVYADISIKLSHVGTYEYTGNLFAGGVNPCNIKQFESN